MLVRKMLDMVFSQHDLAWLDDLLPGKEEEEKKDDKKKDGGKKEKKKVRGGEESEDEVSLNFWRIRDKCASRALSLCVCVCNSVSHIILIIPSMTPHDIT